MHDHSSHILYTAATEGDTSLNVIRKLFNSDRRWWSGSQLVEGFINSLKTQAKAIIIDEISKCQEFRRLMQTLNHIYRETQLPIIVASNNIHFIQNLENDVRLTLFLLPIEFDPYSIEELEQILDERLRLAETEIPEEVKKLIIALAKRENSARVLIELAHHCLQNQVFDIADIYEYAKKYQDTDYKKIFNKLNFTEKQLIKLITDLHEAGDKITSNKIIENCNRYDLKISKGRVSQVLNDFENEYGLITTIKRENFGYRTGQVRTIRLEEDSYKNIKELLE